MLFGKTRARVLANDDPDKRGRVRVELPELFYDPTTGKCLPSPWCEGRGGGGSGLGVLDVPPVGSIVWVQTRASEDGEVYELVYEPGPHGYDDSGRSFVPAVGRGEDDETVKLRASAPFKVPDANSRLQRRGPDGLPVTAPPGPDGARREVFPEIRGSVEIEGLPPSANAGEYPHNRVLKTVGGFTVEIDDTAGRERLHVWHPDGTCLEIGSRGGWVQRQTTRWEETQDNDTSTVGGSWRRQVSGDMQLAVNRNHVEETGQRRVILARDLDISTRFALLMEVGGLFQQKVKGRAAYDFVSDARFSSGGSIELTAAGGVNISALLGPATIFGTTQVGLVSAGAATLTAGAALALTAGAAATLTAPTITSTAGAITNVGQTICVGALGAVTEPAVKHASLLVLLGKLGTSAANPGDWAATLAEFGAALAASSLVTA